MISVYRKISNQKSKLSQWIKWSFNMFRTNLSFSTIVERFYIEPFVNADSSERICKAITLIFEFKKIYPIDVNGLGWVFKGKLKIYWIRTVLVEN